MKPLVVGCMIAALLASGCVSGGTPADAEDPVDPIDPLEWVERAVAGGTDHDHRDPAHHQNRSTPNFEVLAWEPLITDHYDRTSGGHLCGDNAERDGQVLTVVHSFVSDVSVIIVDTTDPAKPEKIGELVLPYTHVYDLAITPDQQHVLLATTTDSGPSGEEGLEARPTFRDACTGKESILPGPEQDLPYWLGLVLVDISDPRAPAVEDYLYLGGGHSVQVEEFDGRTLALVTTQTAAIVEVVETASGSRLVPTTLQPYGQCGGAAGTISTCSFHDGFLQEHPVTGQKLAYLATASALVILDIENPTAPSLVGRWDDWSPLGDAAPSNPFLHEALPMDTVWDGRHYTFTGEECLSMRTNVPSCLVMVLDTTDPANPQFVAAWTHPIELEWDDTFLLYSLHYVAVVDRTLFVSNYHGGLWAVDVSDLESNVSLPTVGVFVPDRVSPAPIGYETSYDWAPAVLDALPQSDGSLVVFDHTSGLYTVKFHADDPMPSPPAWPIGSS